MLDHIFPFRSRHYLHHDRALWCDPAHNDRGSVHKVRMHLKLAAVVKILCPCVQIVDGHSTGTFVVYAFARPRCCMCGSDDATDSFYYFTDLIPL